MTAARTAELMSRLPGWFVEHARVTEEKARRRREILAKRYEILCGENNQGSWSHTIVEFAKRPLAARPTAAPAPAPAAVAEPAPERRKATPTGLEWREFMTPEELRDLTGRRSLSSQLDALKADRIPHRVMRNRLLVSRFHVREWLAGRLHAKSGGDAHLALAS
ncbi:hypothetical protein J2X20_005676 [Pelomonas saccharophila]|uniref:Transcriptional regulator n=1 Tax=Roseateles saccharophilus TaxID=304 RepID=A0ABU1YXJ9_ROSSA|nr:DUF4224 domain-containing protein [Roseateles saccharophilus]MDR7272991.1 hypothetical protein [Roseateles saccharophilus]